MTPERWRQIRDVLGGAVALQTPEREAYLGSACGGDVELRREVESLLASHDRAGSRFLNEPAISSGAAGPTAPPPAAGRQIGPYVITARIGHGGMGEVFSAVRADGHYEHTVAIKVVRGGLAPRETVERFRVERQILAGLDHPNIARLLDGGATDTGEPYLVMELVDGVAIDEYCRTRSLSIDDRLRLFLLVCSAVQYAHQRLVIHRDLKPGNILVSADGMPKLLDFGIAKVFDPAAGAQETQLRPFTPEYASPEQVRGEPVSTASDVYALGVVLYQLLTGRLPYGTEQGSSSAALADAITTHDAGRPSAVATAFARELRGDLDAIVLKALRKEPDKRYASVDHFADDIRRHLDGRPVLARRGTWTYLASRFTRRHRAAVAAAVLVFVTLVTGIVVTAREARVAEANRRRADARFNDVRKLANSLLFEVHDSIANLPGATDARQLILRRSLEYLDSLAKESTNEPDLMRELATAYDRVGTLEGDGTTSNLGRVDAARASREKAVSLREALARDNPGNPQDQVGLGVAYDQYASFELASVGDVVSALAFARRAVAILDREAAAAPRDMAIVDALLRALTDLVWIEVGEGLNGRAGRAEDAVADAQRTLSLSSRAIGLVPSNEGLQFRHANAQLTLGDAFLKAGRRPEALNAYKQADTLLRRLAERGNNSRALINQSALNSKIGDLLLIDGNAAAAVDYYRTGVDETDALAAADPHNDFILQHQVTTHVELGHALVEMGHTLQGVAYMRDALGRIAGLQTAATPLVRSTEMLVRGWLGEGLERQGDVRGAREQYAASKASLNVVRASNASSRVTEYYAMTTDRLGSALVALGDIDQASREFEESRQLLEPLVRSDPEDYELAYTLADTYTRQGLVAAKRAERTTDRALKVLQWQTARERFRESLAVWKNVPNPARISTSGLEVATPDAVLGHLARAEHEIAAFSR